jgi:hypothetical protein
MHRIAARECVHPVASNGDLLLCTNYGSIERDRLTWFCDILSVVLVLRSTRCLSLDVYRANKENEEEQAEGHERI